MITHPAIRTWVMHGLLTEEQGLHVERIHDNSGSIVSALAAAGFNDTERFINALSKEIGEHLLFRGTFLSTPLNPDMTFDTFIISGSNQFAVEVAHEVGKGSSPSYNPFFIYSRTGLGKTHLLNAIGHEVKRLDPKKQVVFVNMVDLAAEFERARERGFRAELLEWLSQSDVLLADDIQFCEGSNLTQINLFAVIERQLQQLGHMVVFSCDVKPTGLEAVEERLISRMGGGLVAEMKMGKKHERAEMIRKFAGGITLPTEVVDYIAGSEIENIRRLKALVKQFVEIARITGREINLEWVREIIPYEGITPRYEKQSIPVDTSRADEGIRWGRRREDTAERFREMIRAAEDDTEYALALQIAISERIKQLKSEGTTENRPLIGQLQRVLQALRDGDLANALKLIEEKSGKTDISKKHKKG